MGKKKIKEGDAVRIENWGTGIVTKVFPAVIVADVDGQYCEAHIDSVSLINESNH